jgi:hypothetical protein
MKITLDLILSIVVLLAALSAVVERGVLLFRPLFLKIKDAEWQNVAKLGAAILLGFGLAFLVRLDVLAMLGFVFAPAAGYAITGILLSFGASFWHPILEWLKTIKIPAAPQS